MNRQQSGLHDGHCLRLQEVAQGRETDPQEATEEGKCQESTAVRENAGTDGEAGAQSGA